MKFPKFLAAIKGAKSGDKAIFSGECDGKRVKNKECILEKEDDIWHICQNYWDGASCENKHGKKYSFSIIGEGFSYYISSIRLVKKTDIQKIAKATKGLPAFQVGYGVKKGKVKLTVKQPVWKEGMFYPEWEKLTPFPEKPSNELVKVGDLVVRTWESGLEKGKIYEISSVVIRGDGDVTVGFMFGSESDSGWLINGFAPLPTQKPSKPSFQIIQEKVGKFNDSETTYSKEGLEFDGKKYTPEEATEYAKKIRREVARLKKLKF